MTKPCQDTDAKPIKRYRTMAEIKRDLFPDAAAEERTNRSRRSYDRLVADLFERKRATPAK